MTLDYEAHAERPKAQLAMPHSPTASGSPKAALSPARRKRYTVKTPGSPQQRDRRTRTKRVQFAIADDGDEDGAAVSDSGAVGAGAGAGAGAGVAARPKLKRPGTPPRRRPPAAESSTTALANVGTQPAQAEEVEAEAAPAVDAATTLGSLAQVESKVEVEAHAGATTPPPKTAVAYDADGVGRGGEGVQWDFVGEQVSEQQRCLPHPSAFSDSHRLVHRRLHLSHMCRCNPRHCTRSTLQAMRLWHSKWQQRRSVSADCAEDPTFSRYSMGGEQVFALLEDMVEGL